MRSLAAFVPLTLLAADSSFVTAFSFSTGGDSHRLSTTSLSSKAREDSRRAFLSKTLITLPYLVPAAANAASVPVQRAVGGAEIKCREEGNCLEKGELDGAVGWNWGGLERCDASDPLCGPDGRLREEALKGKPIPTKDTDLEITDIVEIQMTIGVGSNADPQIMKLGLYGNKCPELVKEMKDLCGTTGLVTSQNLLLGAPVKLGVGGSLTYIRTEERVEFGVASQAKAYAKATRTSKAPEEFVPQPRPSGARLESARSEQSARVHDVAGLISVPKEGLGYGGGLLLGKDDEAYASAFQISATSVPDMDKEGRKVIGQLFDSKSMDVLARLAGSPTRKMIPGQNGGSPLIKTTIDDSTVSSVADLVAKES